MRLRRVGWVTSAQALSSVIAVAQSIVVVRIFGASRSIEVYFAASLLQQILLRLLQTGQFVEVVLPKYIALRNSIGSKAASEAASAVLNWLIVGGALLAGTLWLLSAWIVLFAAPGFSQVDRATTLAMFQWLLPLIVVQLASGFFLSIGNAERAHGRFEAIGCLASVAGICFIIALHSSMGNWVMVGALWVNQLITLCGRGMLLRATRFRYRAQFRTAHLRASTVLQETATGVPFAFANSLFQFALLHQLTFLPAGSVAIVQYARVIFEKLRGLLIRPSSIVFFTNIAETVAQSPERIRGTIRQWLRQTLSIVIVAIAVVWFPLEALLAAIWRSGQFSLRDVGETCFLLRYLMASLLLVAVAVIYQKVNVSLNQFRRQYLAMAIGNCAAALLAWWVIRPLDIQGVIVVLIAHAALYATASLAVAAASHPEFLTFVRPKCLVKLSAVFALSLGCGALLWTEVRPFLLPDGSSRVSLLIGFGCLAAVQLALAGAFGYFIGVAEFRIAFAAVRRGLRRLGG